MSPRRANPFGQVFGGFAVAVVTAFLVIFVLSVVLSGCAERG